MKNMGYNGGIWRRENEMFWNYLLELGKHIAIVMLTIFFSFGGFGGIASLLTWRWKTKFEAIVKAEMDKKLEAYKSELQTTTDELSQTLTEKITKRSKAYDYLIARQYEFYDRMSEFAEKIPDSFHAYSKELADICTGRKDISDETFIVHKKRFMDICDKFRSCSIRYIPYIDINISVKINNLLDELAECVRLADSMILYHLNNGINPQNETTIKNADSRISDKIANISVLIKVVIERDAYSMHDDSA